MVDIQFPAPRSLQFVTEKNVIVAGVFNVLSLFIRGSGHRGHDRPGGG